MAGGVARRAEDPQHGISETDFGFGVEVASLAGVRRDVVEKAKRILAELEKQGELRDANGILLAADTKRKTEQLGLFDREESAVEKELRDIDPDNLTPMQALAVLADLKRRLDEECGG